jgi:hypothetical protein
MDDQSIVNEINKFELDIDNNWILAKIDDKKVFVHGNIEMSQFEQKEDSAEFDVGTWKVDIRKKVLRRYYQINFEAQGNPIIIADKEEGL